MSIDDQDDYPSIPCPYCKREIAQDSVQCPKCKNYLSDDEDQTDRKGKAGSSDRRSTLPQWVIVTAIVMLAVFVFSVVLRIV